MSEYSDEDLIRMMASGNTQENDTALKYIYAHHYNLIKQFILKNSGTPEAAADIFQDGLIILFNKSKDAKFRLSAALSTYLYAVCRNLWRQRLRVKNKEVDLEDVAPFVADEQESNLESIIRTERSDLIADLLEQMGGDCKKMLLYFYFDRLSIKEIMDKMNISGVAVAKNKKSNCMKRLRKLVLNSPLYRNLLK